MADFPTYFVLQAQGGGPYLAVQESSSSDQLSGLLKFSESNGLGPRSRFAIEPSKLGARTGDKRIVHIRSCYNNKYWVPTQTRDGQILITASAKKTDEEISHDNPSSTIINLRGSVYNSVWGFETTSSLAMGKYAKKVDGVFSVALDRDKEDIFLVTDSQNLLVLPSQVAFRLEHSEAKNTDDDEKQEDDSKKYLCYRLLNGGGHYLRFESGVEVTDPVVAHQLFPTNDGNYRIKSLYNGKFWSHDSLVRPFADEDDYSNNALFGFVKLSKTAVAISDLGREKDLNFLGCYYADTPTPSELNHILKSIYPTITKDTRLVVEELVLKRMISHVTYRLDDSRIYDEQIKEVEHALPVNVSRSGVFTVSQTFTISSEVTTSWNNSLSLELGVPCSIH